MSAAWRERAKRSGLAGALLMGALIAALATKEAQPVPFVHQRHVELGIACEACHLGVSDRANAIIPNVELCALCHRPDRAYPKTPASLLASIKDMTPIAWNRVYENPDHVRFSHKRHLRLAGLDCKACHGAMDRMNKPLGRQLVSLEMTRCMACHRKEKITTDCLACHR